MDTAGSVGKRRVRQRSAGERRLLRHPTHLLKQRAQLRLQLRQLLVQHPHAAALQC
jgi:hypothetical protein